MRKVCEVYLVSSASSDERGVELTFPVSQCISMGWSTKGLFLLSELFEGEKSELEKWTAFKNRITTDGNTFFEIYYSIKIETRPGMGAENVRDTIRAVGLRINTGSEIINGDENRRDLYSKLSAETTYIISEVSAADLYSAKPEGNEQCAVFMAA